MTPAERQKLAARAEREARWQALQAAYDKGFADGMQGAECFPEGSELYCEGWQDGREMYHIEKYDEGYWAGRLNTRALTDWPKYLTNCPHFVRGWHKGVTARQHQQTT